MSELERPIMAGVLWLVVWCKIHCVNFFQHTKLVDFWIEFGIKLNLTWKLV